MIFVETEVQGAFVIELEPHTDARGSFARTFCADEFRERGLEHHVAQCSLSRTHRKGTIRGLHYQAAPHEEVKLVRCVAGSIFDVVLDLRPDSPSFLRHHGAVLSSENGRALYIPRGCAHGFQALEDDTDILYQISTPYAPDHGTGVRYDDPAFSITWPLPDPILLERDATYPDFGSRPR